MTTIEKNREQHQQVMAQSGVTIHFSLTLADGMAVDGTEDGQPMTFSLGDGTMIPALEQVMLGLSVGDKQQMSLDPRDTFGFPEEENKHWMNRSDFDLNITLEEGLLIEFGTPDGEQLPGILIDFAEDKVLVDFNHPLAGHEIIFSVEIVAINNTDEGMQ
jgi:FKBP-type peptidyl-prolyl cis-trans isomerase SlpA